MHAAILEWVYAYVASRAVQSKLVALESLSQSAREMTRYQPLQRALERLKANPTSWDAYKDVYEESWVFGHPGTRWSIKDFQKPTPERTAALIARVNALIAQREERIEAERQAQEAQIERLEREVADLRRYLRPGVEYQPGEAEVTRRFPVDLTGWRYGNAELERRLQEHVKAKAREMITVLEGLAPGDLKEQLLATYRRQLDTGAGYYDAIKVTLSDKAEKGYRAYWQPVLQQLRIVLPVGATPHDLDGLSEALRHELQHFAQSYLTAVLGQDPADTSKLPAGVPSRRIRTPQFRQEMEPSHPSYGKDPKVQEALQQLREQGFDPRRIDFHSLDDLEFFTKLADSAASFRKALAHAGPGPADVAFKLFVGAISNPNRMSFRTTEEWHEAVEKLGGYDFVKWFDTNSFFATLKRHALPKWRKAVGEMAKAVLP